MVLALPVEGDRVLSWLLCCEVATLARDGMPLMWPAVPQSLRDRGQVLLTTAISFPVKA